MSAVAGGVDLDLAGGRIGGLVRAADDEFFAAKERLIDPAPPQAWPGRFGDRGAVMDGWESRRRRTPGDDRCLVRLGVPGVVRTVVVDTTHFRGNHPAAFTLEGCTAPALATPDDLAARDWTVLVPRTPLQGDAVQPFAVAAPVRITHARLTIHPDGGVARLRLLGVPVADLREVATPGGRLDLASVASGGLALACSDMFFSSRHHLVMVGDARDMGDGWETRRRRGPGGDWAVVRLAATGTVDRVEIDTSHFVGNHPATAAVDVAHAPDAGPGDVEGLAWEELLAPSPLGPHLRHAFPVSGAGPATHARLRVEPDGGVARLRLWGTVSEDGWRWAAADWLDVQPRDLAVADLLACCGSTRWAGAMADRRPFGGADGLWRAADEADAALGPGDWLEALAAHPRIGERERPVSAWSRQEQSRAATADAAVAELVAAGNRAYEDRFGHTFVIRAAGRSADEVLADLTARLGNDPDTELRVAAGQQAEITRLRLAKLVRPA